MLLPACTSGKEEEKNASPKNAITHNPWYPIKTGTQQAFTFVSFIDSTISGYRSEILDSTATFDGKTYKAIRNTTSLNVDIPPVDIIIYARTAENGDVYFFSPEMMNRENMILP